MMTDAEARKEATRMARELPGKGWRGYITDLGNPAVKKGAVKVMKKDCDYISWTPWIAHQYGTTPNAAYYALHDHLVRVSNQAQIVLDEMRADIQSTIP
ncbi:MAG: hypothetical protein ACYTEQ_01315 [Planctomycetota bacterium]|jgi:hypothetical protein